MRRLLILFIISAFILSIGCGGNASVGVQPGPESMPDPTLSDMAQVDPAAQEAVVQAPPEPEAQPEPVVPGASSEPIGNRVTGTELEAVEEEVSGDAGDVEYILLTADKVMTETEATIKSGTTLHWKNMDGDWPHVLAVETGSGWDTVRHAKSEQIKGGETWEYTFEEAGTFLVRDLFSGKMRMTVTVE
ncbi:MAG: hypothetical protein V1729_06880 [Candidatus Woesearchaeota archaeon]